MFDTTTDRSRSSSAARATGFRSRSSGIASDDTLTVCVFDTSTETSFELEVGAASPLDVFHHPFAYAAHRGLLAEPEGPCTRAEAPLTVA